MNSTRTNYDSLIANLHVYVSKVLESQLVLATMQLIVHTNCTYCEPSKKSIVYLIKYGFFLKLGN